LFVEHRLDPFGAQTVRRAEAGHAGTQDDNICHCPMPPVDDYATSGDAGKLLFGALRGARRGGPTFVLLTPELIAQARGWHLHFMERTTLVLGHVAPQHAILGKRDRGCVDGARGGAFFDQSIATDPADPVKSLTGFQWPL